jgi:hypothetical protein
MQLVCRYYQPAGGDALANKRSINVFRLGDKFDLVGNSAGSRCL